MPKIRGIKPETWTDENFVELSPYARLLWVGLWNFACDNGHLQDKSKQIKMRILPTDDVNCADLLREIQDQGLIERAGGWITIPNLSHHQKPHRRWWSTCDMPGCELPDGASHTPINRGATVAPPKRTRGTTADSDCEVESDGDSESEKPPRAVALVEADRFDEFWDAYDKKEGRKRCEGAYRSALKKPGVTADLLIAAARDYVNSVRSEGKHPQFTKNPLTWLHGEHWTDERVARARPQTRVQEHLTLVQQLAAEEAAQQLPLPEIGYRQ